MADNWSIERLPRPYENLVIEVEVAVLTQGADCLLVVNHQRQHEETLPPFGEISLRGTHAAGGLDVKIEVKIREVRRLGIKCELWLNGEFLLDHEVVSR